MKKLQILFWTHLLFVLSTTHVLSQSSTKDYNYRYPLNIPAVLSANFGELRPDHFHSGIDMKTQAVVNKQMFAIEEGYISRIAVSARGYGLALYIDHPNGHTSVYAHVNKFAPKIEKYLIEQQYEKETYIINLEAINPDILPINKGELIAYSGNTGSSFGPHVHFEIRDTQSEDILDPLPYYMNLVSDTRKPEMKGIAVYPILEKGVVNNSTYVPHRGTIPRNKQGAVLPLQKKINAWGTIGVGLSAIDRMDGVSNTFGVKEVELWCDNVKIFSSNIQQFSFAKSRMINSFIDFNYWKKQKSLYMKTFIEPGNELPIYTSTVDNGYINIDEEREYALTYKAKDLHGNMSQYKFSITGKKQEIPPLPNDVYVMNRDENNYHTSDSFTLSIPPQHLYENTVFKLIQKPSNLYLSDIYTSNYVYTPLAGYASMTIKLDARKDTLDNKAQYGIIMIDDKGKKHWQGGEYKKGVISCKIRELGNKYAITSDTRSPEITPMNPEKWVANKKISIKVTDEISGIASYKGTIDGEYALFKYDTKSPVYSYAFDDTRLEKGKTHQLVFTVTDRCGNEREYNYEFKY